MTYEAARNEIFAHMRSTRGAKYGAFLSALRSFRYLAGRERGEFLESYYVAMRRIDDIVDGDAPLPPGYGSPTAFVDDRLRVIRESRNPRDAADHLLMHSLRLARRLGFDVEPETEDIVRSMRFDAERVGRDIMLPRAMLDEHFDRLDISGTVSATLKLFGGAPEQYHAIEPLGRASRISYNLRDYDEDRAAGFVNVPLEDIERLSIADLDDRSSAPLQAWFEEQRLAGRQWLDEHRRRMAMGRVPLFTRATLRIVYEMPARRHFRTPLAS